MPVSVSCPECGKEYQLPEDSLGRKANCKKCGNTFRIQVTSSKSVSGKSNSEIDSLSSGSSSSSDSLPEQIGRFRVVARLGAGAFGTVYRAYDPVLEREVAVKVPNAGLLSSERDKQRYLREPKAAGQLHHPNIVPVFEANLDGDNIFIVSAFIQGRTLEDALEEKKPDLRRTATLVMKLAGALQYAHDNGIVHRDVKPANIMLDSKGEPLLMDFGLARIQESAEKLTMNEAVLGTPAYMSPEQAAHNNEAVGPASDQYSLGVVLYEMISGQRPFSGPPAIVMSLVIKQEPTAPRSLNQKIPRDLETICLKAMAKETKKRFADCQELADDLEHWLQDEPINARRTTFVERGLRWCRRNPLVAGLTLAVVVVSVIGFLVSSSALGYSWLKERQARASATLAFEKAEEAIAQKKRADENAAEAAASAALTLQEKRRADEKTAEAVKQTEIAKQERDRSKVESRRAYENDYIGQMNLIQHDWDDVNLAQLRQRLTRTRPENTGGDDFRGFEWYYWNRMSNSPQIRMKAEGTFYCGVCTKDGRRIITPGKQTIFVWDATSGKELNRFPNPNGGSSLSLTFGAAISPDDRRLVLGDSAGPIKVVDLESGRTELVIKGHAGIVDNVVFSSDGRRIASASHDKTAKIWDASTGSELLSINGHAEPVYNVVFSPNDDRIATTSYDRTARIWNPATGKEILVLKGHTQGVEKIAFSKDGKLIATGSMDGSVKIWNASNGTEVWTFKGHDGRITSLAFRPDGKELASGGSDTTVRTWDLNTGKETVRLKDHETEVIHMSYSPDGTTLNSASNNGRISVWGPVASQENSIVTRQEHAPTSVSFSPDGRLIACDADTIVKVFDTAEFRLQFSLSGHATGVTCVRFSPSGKLVAASAGDEVRLWSVETGMEMAVLRGTKVGCMAFNPDGTRLAAACGDEIKIWDTATGQEVIKKIRDRPIFNEPIHGIAFDPLGSQVFFTTDLKLRIFDSTTGQYTIADKKFQAGREFGFGANGQLLYGTPGMGIAIWNFTTGKELLKVGISANWGVSIAAFSPDGRRLACVNDPKRIRLFEVSTGQQTLELRGHDDWVKCIAFSPDGRRLVSGSSDKTIRCWTTSDVE